MTKQLWTEAAIGLYHQILGGAGQRIAARVLTDALEISLREGMEAVTWPDVQEAYDAVLAEEKPA